MSAEPREGDTMTRAVLTEKTYRWEADIYGDGDWYEVSSEIIYAKPAWEDVPGGVEATA